MAALLKDRNTKMTDPGRLNTGPVLAATQIFKGALVAATAAGFVVPASDTAGIVVLGIAQFGVDNLLGGSGDLDCTFQKGTAELGTLGTVVDQADFGRPVFVSDDNNVEKTGGVANNIIAGILEKLDPDTGNPLVRIFDPTV